MPAQPVLQHQRTSTLNRRRHLAEIDANRAAAGVDGMKKMLTKSSIVIVYFLICLYLPAIFNQTRNPQCHFNALKANDFFAFLLVGLVAASTIIDYVVYRIACARMQG